MRNIYDIISEQKLLTDINISSYELTYLSEEFQYLQEGIGETLKNVAKKVIEFINTIISKIREMVSKVLNFFRSKKNKKSDNEKLKDEIKDAKGKGIKDGSKEHEEIAEKINKRKENENKANAAEKEKSDKDAEELQKKADADREKAEEKRDQLEKNQKDFEEEKEKKAKNQAETLKNSNQKVRMPFYASLDKKRSLTDKFFKKLSSSINVQMRLSDKDAEVGDYFINSLLKDTFVGDGSPNKNSNASISERIRLELGETGEEKEYEVKQLADIVESYKDINSIGSYIQQMGGLANSELESLKRKFEQLVNAGNEGANKSVAGVNKVATIVSSFVNTMCTDTVKAYQAYNAIYTKISQG